jgi:hypothetical protein
MVCGGGSVISMGRLGRYRVQAMDAVTTMAVTRIIKATIQNCFFLVSATLSSRNKKQI